jgi:hypothetical protein
LSVPTTVSVALVGRPIVRGEELKLCRPTRTDGEIQWFITRGTSMAQRGRRLLRGVAFFAFLLIGCAAWSWYVAGLIAQYLPGSPESLVGVVTTVRTHLYRRQSCMADFDIETVNPATITVCFQAGFLFPQRKLADALPQPGQKVLLRLGSNWFGTVVKTLGS